MTSYIPVGTLAGVTDADLGHLMLALQLACGKAHGAQSEKRRGWFCYLFRTLKVEADLRGLPSPPPTVHVADLPPHAA